MRCRRCSHENEPAANFCSSCGAPLDASDESTAALTSLDSTIVDDTLGRALAELPDGVGMLIVRRGPNEGSRYLLEADSTGIGRHPDSPIFLDDITVSRRHASVIRNPDGYEVTDAGSLNGTYVNRQRIETAPLHNLDEVQVGRFILAFLVGSSGETR